MVLRLHGEALFQEAGSGPQIHECVVHLLAAGYVRYAVTDLDRLVNRIAAAFVAFRLLLALASIAPSRLSACRDVQRDSDHEKMLHREPVWNAWCTSSSEKHVARVGPVDRCVAHRARLVLGGLIMGRSRGTLDRECVTLQAEQIHLAHA